MRVSVWPFHLSAQALDIRFGGVTSTITREMVNAPQFSNQYIGIEAVVFCGWRAKVINRRIVAEQQINTGCDTICHRIQIIATFLNHHQTTVTEKVSLLDNNLCQACEASDREIHVPDWIFPVGVKHC